MEKGLTTISGLAAKKHMPTSTVGRGRSVEEVLAPSTTAYRDDLVTAQLGNSAALCAQWPSPVVIVSDGAYGVLGFEGDTSGHLDMPEWYEPNVVAWSKRATPLTTLWFWNSEIGWAAVHPLLERHGWRYINANIWNKGIGHIAGNVNTAKIRRFPVVSEVCVQYVFEARVRGTSLREWLLTEWKRTGLAMRLANDACGVKDAAVRKYMDQGHLLVLSTSRYVLANAGVRQYAWKAGGTPVLFNRRRRAGDSGAMGRNARKIPLPAWCDKRVGAAGAQRRRAIQGEWSFRQGGAP